MASDYNKITEEAIKEYGTGRKSDLTDALIKAFGTRIENDLDWIHEAIAVVIAAQVAPYAIFKDVVRELNKVIDTRQ